MALAPMANVTDAAFRRIIAKYSKWGGQDIGDGSKVSLPDEAFRVGGPDVMFTEFTSADGLMSEGREKLLIDLMYSESERPIVAQLFSGNPEKMYEAAKLVKELGFDGLDINMGCPDRSIEKSGAGAALMKNPRLAREIIRAAKEGVSDSPLTKGALPTPPARGGVSSLRDEVVGAAGGMSIPISIKTRLGYNTDILEEWLPELLAEKPAAVTLHARTRKEMSKVPARWERVKRAVEIRDELRSGTLILGNGDVVSLADAHQKVRETVADGIMLGRAIFGNPWLFAGGKRSDLKSVERSDLKEPSIEVKLRVLVEHAKLFEELLGGNKSFAIMKKHFKAYAEGFVGAKELRMKLMEADSLEEAEEIIGNFLA